VELLASCLQDLTALGTGGLAVLVGAMVLAGFAGGFAHCALMCAPFVLAQVAAGADRSLAGGTLTRLAGAALLPYHFGRLLGYALLGGFAGALSGLVSGIAGVRGWLALPLLLAALVCLGTAVERLGVVAWPARLRIAAPGEWLHKRIGRLLDDPAGPRGVLLGLLLSALPCGLLYGALAGAAASGSALAGALAMMGFVLGTVPALVAVGMAGRLALRRADSWLRPAGTVLLFANAALLAALALRQVAGV